MSDFLDALHREIDLQNFLPRGEKIETVYFGGGTPSLLAPGEIEKILFHLQRVFSLSSKSEITLEANPDDISRERLNQWAESGINRLSVGIQSFNNEELKWMNRAHNAEEAINCLNLIADSTFDNYSCDLIYGSHLSTKQSLAANLEVMMKYHVPHLSCYALTKENKTAFAYQVEKNIIGDTDEAMQADQFNLLVNTLAVNGYEHYEISNFAMPGYRSRHNSSYWKGLAYLGLGPSAHSFNGRNIRQWNVANNAKYIQALMDNTVPVESEILSQVDQLNEYLMISVRTMEGIDPNFVELRFGKEARNNLEDKLQGFKKSGKIELVNLNYSLTEEGKFFADGIAASLFF